jgi:hypothetical protein
MAREAKRKPHQEALTLETLGDLAGGQARAVVNAALRAAVRDLEDRGGDEKPRKVTIEVVIEKVSRDGSGVLAKVKAKTGVPPYETDPTFGDLQTGERGQPEMAFSPSAPENPDQPPLSGLDRDA